MDLDTPDQFWLELDKILALAASDSSSADIDDVLRSYLALATQYKDTYLTTHHELEYYVLKLRKSPIFEHANYVRMQLIYCILQEDDPSVLYIVSAVLLLDAREHEEAFTTMQQEDVFPRLVDLIRESTTHKDLHKILLVLMYEMVRIVPIAWNNLATVNDEFVLSLLAIIESVSDDASDPYHYQVIRVLLVLNEQYMNSISGPGAPNLTNRVLKAISTHAAIYKTFGENLILLLNRESQTSLQLLILKLLYLIFGNRNTAEYFYTNDLHVLTDVILRNLLDLPLDRDILPSEADDPDHGVAPMQALRHTYLRVLHPLLENSQLNRPGGAYKRPEIRAVLQIVAGDTGDSSSPLHFAPIDETTIRLTERCRNVVWLRDEAENNKDSIENENETENETENKNGNGSREQNNQVVQQVNVSKSKLKKRGPPPKPPPARGKNKLQNSNNQQGHGYLQITRRSLGMSVDDGGESSLSIQEVAKQVSKPGVITPSRRHQEEKLG